MLPGKRQPLGQIDWVISPVLSAVPTPAVAAMKL